MWCKKCNIETNEDICPICGEKSVEDIPAEVYWCSHCKTPVIQTVNQPDVGTCPLCGRKAKYLSSDLRPVFPQERLLLEVLLGLPPHEYKEKSVWAADSRYYIDGKSVNIPSKTFQLADADAISKVLTAEEANNTYEFFDMHIANFVAANQSRLHYLIDEAHNFVKDAASKFDEEHIVVSFSGGKDSTVTADVVTKALSNPELTHIFGNTTLEFPYTIQYASEATAWYYFFNEFSMSEFSKEDFVSNLQSYVLMKGDGAPVAIRSLNDDFTCIVNTYLPRHRSGTAKESPENNIDSPLGELGLIDVVNKAKKTYKKVIPSPASINPWVALAVIQEQAQGRKELSLNELLTAPCNIGRVFNLDAITMLDVLRNIEKIGEIKIIRTAGLDVIKVNSEKTFQECVDTYYSGLNE